MPGGTSSSLITRLLIVRRLNRFLVFVDCFLAVDRDGFLGGRAFLNNEW
jgi:hypothetical protein